MRAVGVLTPLIDAPTEMTPSATAGLPTVCSPGPELPAEATTTTPSLVAALAARPSGSEPSPGPPKLMLITSARFGLSEAAARSRAAMMSASQPKPRSSSTL